MLRLNSPLLCFSLKCISKCFVFIYLNIHYSFITIVNKWRITLVTYLFTYCECREREIKCKKMVPKLCRNGWEQKCWSKKNWSGSSKRLFFTGWLHDALAAPETFIALVKHNVTLLFYLFYIFYSLFLVCAGVLRVISVVLVEDSPVTGTRKIMWVWHETKAKNKGYK